MLCYSRSKNYIKAKGIVILDTGCCITGRNITKPSLCFVLFFCLTALSGLDLICYYSSRCFIPPNTEELLFLTHITLLSLHASLVKPFLISSSPLSSSTVIKQITFTILLCRYHYCWTPHQRALHSFTTCSFTHSPTHPPVHSDCKPLYQTVSFESSDCFSIPSFSLTAPPIQ